MVFWYLHFSSSIGGNPCCIGVGFEAQYHLGGFGSHSFQCAFCSLVHGVFMFFFFGGGDWLVGAYFLWRLVELIQNIDLFDVWWIFSATIWICNWRVSGCAPEKGTISKGKASLPSSIFHWMGRSTTVDPWSRRGTPSWGRGPMSLQISRCFYHVGCSAWFLWFIGCSSDLMGFPPSLHSDASFQLPTMVDGYRPPPEDYPWS